MNYILSCNRLKILQPYIDTCNLIREIKIIILFNLQSILYVLYVIHVCDTYDTSYVLVTHDTMFNSGVIIWNILYILIKNLLYNKI